MSTVPYTFANSVGNIPLAYLDANFSNVKAAANTAGTVTTAAQPNITSVGTLSSLTVTGNVTAANFTGNISGNISNAVYAESAGTAGTVTTTSQPNITSVGTLTVLTASGNIRTTGGAFVGSAAGLTSIPGANVTGTVANATYAVSAGSATTATTAGTVTTAAQPNITSVGTLSSLTVTGNITSSTGVIIGNASGLTNLTGANVTGTVANATSAITAGTVTTAAQPNITSVGTLSSLTVTGNITSSANISGAYILGNGSQLTGLPASYSNSNVTTLLAAFGSNTISTSGNVSAGNVILGTGSKILGDFTSTVANGRTVFQTTSTTTNGYTGITAIPGDNNTLGNSSAISLYSSSNVGNSSWSAIQQANTEARLISSKFGLGSYLPITVYTSDLERVKFDINGNVGIGNSTPLDALAVTGNAYVSNNITSNTIKTTPVALSSLTASAGARSFINDGNLVASGNFGAQVGNGGSNTVPVWSDGTNWYIG